MTNSTKRQATSIVTVSTSLCVVFVSFVLLCVLYKHHLNFKRKREVDLNFADNEIKCLIFRDLSARKIILNLKQQKEVIGNKWSYSTSRNYFWINTAFFFVNISFFFEIKYLMISKSCLTWLEITVLWPYPLLFCIISNNFLRFVLQIIFKRSANNLQ